MIAYNKTLLEQTLLVEEARNLKESGFINHAQYQLIESKLPTLKTQNSLLIRGGLFLVGLILCASICGVISLFSFSILSRSGLEFVAFSFAILAVVGLEWMVRHKGYLGYGLDDSFIVSAQLALATALFRLINHWDMSETWTIWFWLWSVVLMTTFFAIRYLHVLSAFAACISLTFVVGYWLIEEKIGVTPLMMMVFAVILAISIEFLSKRIAQPWMTKVMKSTLYYSYILFYVSGNFWVVRSFSYYYYYSEEQTPVDSMPWIFYFYAVFSFLVPVLYVYYSVKRRDKGLLWIGIITLFFSFYSLMQMVYFTSVAWWMTLGGLLLFGLILCAIKSLKQREIGVTFEPDRLHDDSGFIDAEALLVAAQMGLKPEAAQEAPMKFGGGGFSGGGAGGSY